MNNKFFILFFVSFEVIVATTFVGKQIRWFWSPDRNCSNFEIIIVITIKIAIRTWVEIGKGLSIWLWLKLKRIIWAGQKIVLFGTGWIIWVWFGRTSFQRRFSRTRTDRRRLFEICRLCEAVIGFLRPGRQKRFELWWVSWTLQRFIQTFRIFWGTFQVFDRTLWELERTVWMIRWTSD